MVPMWETGERWGARRQELGGDRGCRWCLQSRAWSRALGPRVSLKGLTGARANAWASEGSPPRRRKTWQVGVALGQHRRHLCHQAVPLRTSTPNAALAGCEPSPVGARNSTDPPRPPRPPAPRLPGPSPGRRGRVQGLGQVRIRDDDRLSAPRDSSTLPPPLQGPLITRRGPWFAGQTKGLCVAEDPGLIPGREPPGEEEDSPALGGGLQSRAGQGSCWLP